MEPQNDRVEVRVVGVYVEHYEGRAKNLPLDKTFVLLRDKSGRELRIWIARDQAVAISLALDGETSDRPFTHDLVKNLLDGLDAHLEEAVINDVREETFYAQLLLTYQQKTLLLDARPSDSIALALRMGAPLYVTESVMESVMKHDPS